VLSLTLSVEVVLAPSISASMTQYSPVDTQVTIGSVFVPSIVGVFSEHSVTVGVVQIGSVAIVLPGIVASGSKSAHTAPHHWPVADSHVDSAVVIVSVTPRANIEVLVTGILIPIVRTSLSMERMTIGGVRLDPPVSVGVGLECEVDLLITPLVHVRVCLASMLAVVIEVGMAPVAAASVAQSPPVNSDVTILSSTEFAIASVNYVEVGVGTVEGREIGTEASPVACLVASVVTVTAPDHRLESRGSCRLGLSLSNSSRLGSNVVSLIVVVQIGLGMSVMSTLTVGVDVPAMVDLSVERDINELISPAVHLLSVFVVDLSLNINSGVAPSPVRSVAHVIPVHSESTDSDGSPQTIVVVLSGEVSVVVRPELNSSRAVILPSLSSMSSLATHTTE
jgi:hypothetical protein